MTSAAGTPGGNPAPPFSVPPNKVGEEATAAAALAAVGGGMTQSPAAAQGPASAAGADLPLCDAADDEGTDDLGDPAMQRRNSGSLSTHDRSDWRGGSEGGGQRASGEQPLESPEDDQGQPQQRGRRNSRQQEQNKQAQQRYRAKRKAQFEDLQRKVQVLSSEAADAQRQRQENDRLRAEMAKLRAMLEAAATVGPAAAAAAVAAAPHLPSAVGVSDGLAQPGRPLQNGWTQARASPLAPTLTNGNGGAFRPTATTRQLAPATLAELPLPAGAQPQQQAQVLSIPAKQVQAALNLYYQDLQVFAASVQLERVPLDGAGLGADAAGRLSSLVRTGVELVKMVLQASGPDAAALLTADMPSVGPDGVSPADSLAQWRAVAGRVALTLDQRVALADWRRRFLAKLDDCYGRRLLHKAALAQLPTSGAGAGQAPQWMEALLLQAAESVGFSACAMACAQLEGMVGALAENVAEERAAACAMMTELLDRILTKVQAARFLLAGHPFCWNGLSFAHAVASMQLTAAPAPTQVLSAAHVHLTAPPAPPTQALSSAVHLAAPSAQAISSQRSTDVKMDPLAGLLALRGG